VNASELVRAARRLLATPATSGAAVVTLALGIGGSAAIFSVVDAVLLHPLPYAGADRLVVMWQHDTRTGTPLVELSYDEYEAWRKAKGSFDDVAAMTATNFRVNVTGRGEPVQAEGALVSAQFFDMLGVRTVAGRGFRADDDAPGAAPVGLVREGYWRRQFGGDPSLLGQALTMDGDAVTVVGVLPEGTALPRGADFWFPAGPGLGTGDVRQLRILKLLGRLKDGASLESASSEMELLTAQLEKERPKDNEGLRARLVPLARHVYGDARQALWLLFAAIGFVTLIGCANVANLLLLRGKDREGELALRLAIGASRGRIVAEVLRESALLALCGGALGLLLAHFSVASIVARVPADLPRLDHVSVDWRVYAFTFALALLTALVFGTLPALRASGLDPADALRGGGRRATDGRGATRLRSGLVLGEIALSLALLTGAGLAGRSLLRLVSLDPGFDAKNVLTARLNLPNRYPAVKDRAAFFTPMLERLEALPGVATAGIILLRPLSDPIGWDYDFTIEGQTADDQKKNPPSNYVAVSAGFFEAMRVPVLKGRLVGPEDGPDTQRVVVVSRALAERYWPGEDPLGRRLKFGGPDSKGPWHTVVGVVGDVRNRGWTSTWLDCYVPYQQWNFGRMDLVVRTVGDPEAMLPSVRQAVYAGDPEVPIASATTMEKAVAQATAGPRFTALLLGVFALVAVAMATIGLYGLVAQGVARRTREIGVRMALGAASGDVLSLVLGQAARLVLAGLVAGVGLAFATSRGLSGLLYGIGSTDPATFALTAGGLAAVALGAAALAARRATRIDPMHALRQD
jgi:predicted permease